MVRVRVGVRKHRYLTRLVWSTWLADSVGKGGCRLRTKKEKEGKDKEKN